MAEERVASSLSQRKLRSVPTGTDATSTTLVLDSTDLLFYILMKLSKCEDIARSACTCRNFRDAARSAGKRRGEMAEKVGKVALPPTGRREAAPENLMRRVRWAELVAARPRSTLGPGNAHMLCASPRGGALCTWGFNHTGQLGAGQDWQKVMAPRRVDVVVEDEGVPPPAHHPHFALGDEPPLEVGAAVYPVEVVAGGNHSLMIDSAGSVWSWGVGVNGRLGHGDTAWLARPKRILTTRVLQRPQLKIVQVSAGLTHNLMLNGCGVVFAFGANTLGQLGLGDHGLGNDRLKPQAINPTIPVPSMEFGGRRVVDVTAGAVHSAAVCEEGFLWTWGPALDGRLGHGDDRNQHKPTRVPSLAWAEEGVRAVSAGGQHTLCITEAGELYAMGQGKHGQLGLGDTVSRWRPQKVAALAGKPVRIASAGHEHSAILTEAGEVYTMGDGSRGQLGHAELGYKQPKLVEALAPPLTATQVKGLKVGELTKELARLGIAAKEELGKLRKEELAKHLLAAQPERARVVEVAAGTNRTFAKTADGWMYSWGGGDHGALGHGDELRQTLPKRLTCEEVVPDAFVGRSDAMELAALVKEERSG